MGCINNPFNRNIDKQAYLTSIVEQILLMDSVTDSDLVEKIKENNNNNPLFSVQMSLRAHNSTTSLLSQLIKYALRIFLFSF